MKVTQSSTNLGPSPAPAPSSGGVVSSSPAFSLPFHPRQADSPSPAPSGSSSSIVPDKGGGIPFINSNPAVPLPTGEVDSATIRPLPTSAHGGRQVYMYYATLSLSPMYNHFYMSLVCAIVIVWWLSHKVSNSHKISISHRGTSYQIIKLSVSKFIYMCIQTPNTIKRI